MRATTWMGARAGTATAMAMCLWATGADAATWVRYGFSGTGSATNLSAGSYPGMVQPVAFSGQVYVDLDRHVADFMTGQFWNSDGGTFFSTPSAYGGLPYTAAAGPGSLNLSVSENGGSSGFQTWSVAALLSNGLGADGRFPLFTGTQAASGTVAFNVGNNRSALKGSGQISALTMARVDAPGAWLLSITPGPVPEPTTWATLILGFAVLGAGMRYRRRSTRVQIG